MVLEDLGETVRYPEKQAVGCGWTSQYGRRPGERPALPAGLPQRSLAARAGIRRFDERRWRSSTDPGKALPVAVSSLRGRDYAARPAPLSPVHARCRVGTASRVYNAIVEFGL